MFLYEALILGLIGAAVGGVMTLVIGYSVVSAMIGSTAYFFLSESIIYVPYGMIIEVVVCVASGLYPAWKASNMISSMRSWLNNSGDLLFIIPGGARFSFVSFIFSLP